MQKKLSDDHYLGALIEDTNDKVSGLVEVVSLMNVNLVDVKSRVETIEQQTTLIKPMFAAIKDQSKILAEHEHRITSLEGNN